MIKILILNLLFLGNLFASAVPITTNLNKDQKVQLQLGDVIQIEQQLVKNGGQDDQPFYVQIYCPNKKRKGVLNNKTECQVLSAKSLPTKNK